MGDYARESYLLTILGGERIAWLIMLEKLACSQFHEMKEGHG
jgi:hypothetical protein